MNLIVSYSLAALLFFTITQGLAQKIWNIDEYSNKDLIAEIAQQELNNRYSRWQSRTKIEDNGVIQLILQTYINQVLREMQNEVSPTRLTEDQINVLQYRLKGLYNHLKYHPALMERRLIVGSRKPDFLTEQEHYRTNIYGVEVTELHAEKRNGVLREVCPSRTEWVTLNRSKDMYDNEVEVFQPPDGVSEGTQWFYTTKCLTDVQDRPCEGIPSVMYKSKCLIERSYVMAFIRRPDEENYDWDWIHIPTSCNCAITPKL